jgi:uncharacterized membrane protein YeaQ/YmgE (transglycosylase-associated protein family)
MREHLFKEADMHIVLLVVVGALLGAVARFVGLGKVPGPLLASMCVGVAGALMGQFVGRLSRFSGEDAPADFIAASVGACLLVIFYRTIVLRPTAV